MATETFVKELMENADFKLMMKSMHENTTKVIRDLLDTHTKRIEEMEKTHLNRIEKMEREHRAKIEQLEGKLNEMEETQNCRMQTTESHLHKVKESHGRRIEQMEGEVHTLGCENIQLKTNLKSHEDQIDDLLGNLEATSMALEDQLQYSRRNCLVVTGVPEKKGVEDTDETIKSFAADKLGLEITDMDIDRTHRLGRRQGTKPRPIIVKFVRYNLRRKFMKQRKKLKGQGIGIQELLTPFAEHLLGKAQDLSSKAPWLKKVWTWDGRIVCLVQLSESHPEQKITVTCHSDLDKIWLKGKSPSPKSPWAKKKINDPDYMETAWEKTEKKD